ncbi:MAG: PRC-barrel domain-containing protein [Pirellulales bacterium]|nr:PRC-barrel domain-containing protein [Pirellulales bacterium]
MRTAKLLLGATALSMIAGLWLQAAEPAPTPREPRAPAAAATRTDQVTTARHYRLSTLTGMQVRNPNGEELGKIEDYVVDMETGRISYVALSFGGFLGIGDKLFAMPFSALTLQRDADENYFFVLALSKQSLEKAPGFDKEHWPNVADPKWSAEIDQYYREHLPRKVSQRPAEPRR